MKKVWVGNFYIGEDAPLCFISGPCVIESEDHALFTAEKLLSITSKFNINFIYKSSFDKANRMSVYSYRGPGIEKGLQILQRVKEEFNIPVVSDVHTPEQAYLAKDVCDMLQIPAFLCRQTDLITSCAKTQKPLHVKKGQFLAPHDMKTVVEKITASGNDQILLGDRGTSFGYNNLVSDMRAIAIMQKTGFPVCFDASHSVQLPGGMGNSSGGQREFIPLLSRCAIAAGCNAIYMESHPDPTQAKSDAHSVMPLGMIENILTQLTAIYETMQANKTVVLESSYH